MTQIDFYVGMNDRLNFAYRLVRKIYKYQSKIVVTGDIKTLKIFDDLLWKSVPTDFIPHCFVHDVGLVKTTPVILCDIDFHFSFYEVLINIGENIPCHFSRYERLLEVIGNDSVSVKAARHRYIQYKKLGYLIKSHKIL